MQLDRRRLLAGSGALLAASAFPAPALAKPEQTLISIGFVKMADMAPLAVARDRGFFRDEGLEVDLIPQSSWRRLMDNLEAGWLDGAHMPAAQPLAARAGVKGDMKLVAPYAMSRNGAGVTVSRAIWALMKGATPMRDDGKPVHPISARALRPAIESYAKRGENLVLGMVWPVSNDNYELRYWLGAGGVHPGFYGPKAKAGSVSAEVQLVVFPPSHMPIALKAALLDGFCAGEPWNQQAVIDRTGVPVITNHEIWPHNAEKVFGMPESYVEQNPATVRALVKALIRAGKWLDAENGANREAAVELIRRPDYVGASAKVLRAPLTGTFEYEEGDRRPTPDFNIFFRDFASYPYYSDAVWFLTQMRRWGQLREDKPDSWYLETAKQVYRPDLYLDAAKALIAEGKADRAEFPWDSDGDRRQKTPFIDGRVFDAAAPNAYINGFEIGLKTGDRVKDGAVVKA